ncbi:MAG: LysM peptidoglycan-binding domain-containing protein [Chloroflexota bacterium]
MNDPRPSWPKDPVHPEVAADPPIAVPGAGEAEATLDSGSGPPPGSATVEPAVDYVTDPCRYLVSAGGAWRTPGPSNDHRCAALDPVSQIAPDKQRRLCLTPAHPTCPTYTAAREARERTPGLAAGWVPVRPIVRTAPVVLEAPSRRPTLGLTIGTERLAQAALAVMAVVVVALVGARLLGGTDEPVPTGPAGGLTVATTAPTAAHATTSPKPTTTGVPSVAPETAAPSGASPSGEPSASPAPTKSPTRTYTVKRGDTLSGIAAKFGTTVAAILKLNPKITDGRTIYSGQKLKIP